VENLYKCRRSRLNIDNNVDFDLVRILDDLHRRVRDRLDLSTLGMLGLVKLLAITKQDKYKSGNLRGSVSCGARRTTWP
jgi:hypothetical protein